LNIRSITSLLGLLALVSAPLVACDSDSGDKTPEEVHFAYSGTNGPEQWGDLKEEWATCKTGVEQSPVDIDTHVTPGHVEGLSMVYGSSKLNILNNGHTVQANIDAGSSIELAGKRFDLKQFHFHAKSEHTVAGQHMPLEMHLVHQAADGTLAVVGVMFDEGAENAALKGVFSNLPAEESEVETIEGVTLEISNLVPAITDAWTYEGSLTTPPCSEGVNWIVMAEGMEVSTAQLKAFTDVIHDNYRPTQSLGARSVHGAHWAYEGEAGPEHWGELSHEWETCESGVEQSPIDIDTTTAPAEFASLSTTYGTSALKILNNGHTVQVNVDEGSSIDVAGKSYSLLQFHFHAGSEHTRDAAQSPIEMHMVHQAADKSLAVLGVFITEGEENAALKGVFSNLPTTTTPVSTVAGETVDIGALLPADLKGWSYAGSLTTPPCSEGVSWMVMADDIEASKTQIDGFTAIFDDNFRPVQALGARSLTAGN
jgi:carbonic anhydrase